MIEKNGSVVLKHPELLLINCLGSYFYSISNHVYSEEKINPILYYLIGGELVYEEINVIRLKREKGNNPWRYQPIGIVKKDEKTIAVDQYFFDYLEEYLGISVVQLFMDGEKNLIHELENSYLNGFFSICKVDEFYIKESKKYKKYHNSHYLLVKTVDVENQLIEVIDSEENHCYTIKYNEIIEAFYENTFIHKVYQVIPPEESRVIKFDDSIKANLNYAFIKKMIDNVHTIESRDLEYCFRGYRYNILSKIIPFTELQKALIDNVECKNVEELEKIINISNAWKNLNAFMSYKILKKDYALEKILGKLKAIKFMYIEY